MRIIRRTARHHNRNALTVVIVAAYRGNLYVVNNRRVGIGQRNGLKDGQLVVVIDHDDIGADTQARKRVGCLERGSVIDAVFKPAICPDAVMTISPSAAVQEGCCMATSSSTAIGSRSSVPLP